MSCLWFREGDFPLQRTRDFFATAVGAHACTGFMYSEYFPGGEEVLYVYIDTMTRGSVKGLSEQVMNQVRNSTDLKNILFETKELFGQSECFPWSHLQDKPYGLRPNDVRVGSHIMDCVKAATTSGQFRLYNLCDECENSKTAHGCVHALVVNTTKTGNSETDSGRKPVRSRRYSTRPMLSFGFIRRPCHRIQTVKSFFQTTALANGFHGFLYREMLEGVSARSTSTSSAPREAGRRLITYRKSSRRLRPCMGIAPLAT